MFAAAKRFRKKFSSSRQEAVYHRNQVINSPGHQKLCGWLEKVGFMYSLESPLIIPGVEVDSGKEYRLADLIVFYRDRYVFVEIDGLSHCTQQQRQDDWSRDRSVWASGGKVLRFGNQYVLDHTAYVLFVIASDLIPECGAYYGNL